MPKGSPMIRPRFSALAGFAAYALLHTGCGGRSVTGQHPLTNNLDPAFATVKPQTLAALPFWSDISEQDDPDKVAASMAESKFFRALLATPTGYTVQPSSEVALALERDGLKTKLDNFYKNWTSDQEDVDEGFLRQVASAMKADGVVVGVVDVWAQHPVDLSQTGTARTEMGLLIGLFDGTTGKRLWLGRDENYREALRYTGAEAGNVGAQQSQRSMERTNLRTATGAYGPPDYGEVVDSVVLPLVRAFPKPR